MSDGVHLVGEQVRVSGLTEPVAGHGQFRVENPGAEAVHAAVAAAWLEVGERKRPLEPATVFDTGRDRALDPGGFEIEPGGMTFLLGFPSVPHEAGPGEGTQVGMRLEIEGSTVEARSPIVFERRIPPLGGGRDA